MRLFHQLLCDWSNASLPPITVCLVEFDPSINFWLAEIEMVQFNPSPNFLVTDKLNWWSAVSWQRHLIVPGVGTRVVVLPLPGA